MTLQELIDKLNSLLTNEYMPDIKSNSEIYFFAEDDYNTMLRLKVLTLKKAK